jgi:hypothetical protein
VSRGIVLWPDAGTAGAVRAIWDVLTAHGLPSMATHTHRLHQPHCSLTVSERLPADQTLDAIDVVPSRSIPLLVGSVGVFPPAGTLLERTLGRVDRKIGRPVGDRGALAAT